MKIYWAVQKKRLFTPRKGIQNLLWFPCSCVRVHSPRLLYVALQVLRSGEFGASSFSSSPGGPRADETGMTEALPPLSCLTNTALGTRGDNSSRVGSSGTWLKQTQQHHLERQAGTMPGVLRKGNELAKKSVPSPFSSKNHYLQFWFSVMRRNNLWLK